MYSEQSRYKFPGLINFASGGCLALNWLDHDVIKDSPNMEACVAGYYLYGDSPNNHSNQGNFNNDGDHDNQKRLRIPHLVTSMNRNACWPSGKDPLLVPNFNQYWNMLKNFIKMLQF